MSPKIRFLVLASVFLGVAYWWRDRSPYLPEQNQPTAAKVEASADQVVPPAPTPAAAVLKPSAANSEAWRPALRDEFRRAGQLEQNPDKAERRLDRLAESLSEEEADRLATLTLDLGEDGDARAVAAELLARARSAAAVENLGKVAASPVPALGDANREAFERALRGRAVEGLGAHPSPKAEEWLMKTADRTGDVFILDRVRRALAARRGQAPAPEEQDREALRKLIE